MEDPPSCQIIIIDMNSVKWKERARHADDSLITYPDLVRTLCLFSAAHVAMHRLNSFCVISSNSSDTKVLFSSDPVELNWKSELATKLLDGIYNTGAPEDTNTGSLAQALSLALCVSNRKLLDKSKSHCKILVTQLSPDYPATYNSMMNSIFSAQKMGVPVDALVLSSLDSSFLQQACFLTGGIYQRPMEQRDSLQLLISHMLPSIPCRSVLKLPILQSVDFRASCSCHGLQQQFAYMCSVCLSLACDDKGSACQVCGTPVRQRKDMMATGHSERR